MEEDLVALVAQAQRNDTAAFSTLIRRFERTALAIAYAQLGDADLASDAVQEAFLRAWQRLSSLQDPARFAPWLCGIVRNQAIDQQRKRKTTLTEIDVAAEGHSAVGDPSEALDRDDRRRHIVAALETLDEVSRCVIALKYFEGLGSREIGELLGLSTAAIDMRLSRARQDLRHRLGPLVGDNHREAAVNIVCQSRT